MSKETNRRNLLRGGTAAVLGGLLLSRAYADGTKRAAPSEPQAKVTVLPACLACTGCIAICPKGAISSIPDGTAVSDDLCVRCGYCVAACPVGGLRINRESTRG